MGDYIFQLHGDRMLRTPEILDRVAVSESHWRRLERAGQCPCRRSLGRRARGLLESEVDHWLAWCGQLRTRFPILSDDVVLPRWSAEADVPAHPRGIEMIHRDQVQRLVGLKHSRIYDYIKAGELPAPYRLGRRVSRWAAHEIDGWLRGRAEYVRELRRRHSLWPSVTV